MAHMLRLAAFLRWLADVLDPQPIQPPSVVVVDLAAYRALVGDLLRRQIAEQAMNN